VFSLFFPSFTSQPTFDSIKNVSDSGTRKRYYENGTRVSLQFCEQFESSAWSINKHCYCIFFRRNSDYFMYEKEGSGFVFHTPRENPQEEENKNAQSSLYYRKFEMVWLSHPFIFYPHSSFYLIARIYDMRPRRFDQMVRFNKVWLNYFPMLLALLSPHLVAVRLGKFLLEGSCHHGEMPGEMEAGLLPVMGRRHRSPAPSRNDRCSFPPSPLLLSP